MWEPVLATDWMAPPTATLRRVSDGRAQQYWDRGRLLSKSMGETGKKSIVWDQVLVYGRGAIWREAAPPKATVRVGPVVDVVDELVDGLHRALAGNAGAHIKEALPGSNPRAQGELRRRGTRLARKHVYTVDAVFASCLLLRGCPEAIKTTGDPNLLQADLRQVFHELCLRQSAGDSTGPKVDVSAGVLGELNIESDVRKVKASAGFQYSDDLCKSAILLWNEVKDAV